METNEIELMILWAKTLLKLRQAVEKGEGDVLSADEVAALIYGIKIMAEGAKTAGLL